MSAFDDLVQNVTDLQTAADDHENRIETIEGYFNNGLRAQLDFPMDPQTVSQIQSLFPCGTAYMSSGTVTVVDGRVAITSIIMLSRGVASGTMGHLAISSQSNGQFTISSSASETNPINYVIFNPYVS